MRAWLRVLLVVCAHANGRTSLHCALHLRLQISFTRDHNTHNLEFKVKWGHGGGTQRYYMYC